MNVTASKLGRAVIKDASKWVELDGSKPRFELPLRDSSNCQGMCKTQLIHCQTRIYNERNYHGRVEFHTRP